MTEASRDGERPLYEALLQAFGLFHRRDGILFAPEHRDRNFQPLAFSSCTCSEGVTDNNYALCFKFLQHIVDAESLARSGVVARSIRNAEGRRVERDHVEAACVVRVDRASPQRKCEEVIGARLTLRHIFLKNRL